MASNKDEDLRSLEKARELEETPPASSGIQRGPEEMSMPQGMSVKACEPLKNVVGYECEFVSQPPSRSDCPICLLVFREPHQATCCGKIFCKACIYKLKNTKHPCPTCKTEDFSCYPDKGLQQELYSSRVYCPKKSQSCDWEGELIELDKHLDADDKDPGNLERCKYVLVNCDFCMEPYPRGELAQHAGQECTKRPFTCPTCEDYKSTYDDVIFVHTSVCKCRPVNCPNDCGQIFEHQHLEKHLSTQCELALVDCYFTGCEVKVIKKDLPGHLADNMVAHMSFLALENMKLKTELQQLRESIAADKMLMTNRLTRTPPLYISYPWKKYAQWSGVFCYIIDESEWLSEPFYSHYGGYKLRLKIWCTCNQKSAVKGVFLAYELLGSKFEAEPNITLFVQTSVLDQENGSNLLQKNIKITKNGSESLKLSSIQVVKCIKREHMEVCVERVSVLKFSTGEISN